VTLRRILALVALAGVFLRAHPTEAQEAAPAVAPQSVDLTAPEEPIRMRAGDAARLSARHAAPAAEPATPATGGVSRTVTLDPPAVVNGSRRFLFHDATDRSAAERTPLSLAERRANVEAYRQSLAPARRRAPAR
jgi:hypothetical protein